MMRGSVVATVIGLTALGGVIAFPLIDWAKQIEVVEQIKNINSFHHQVIPSDLDILTEINLVRYTYGRSSGEAYELVLTAARSGSDWEHQKKLGDIAIGMATWDKSCGGKCSN
jgi:hypothetical protein